WSRCRRTPSWSSQRRRLQAAEPSPFLNTRPQPACDVLRAHAAHPPGKIRPDRRTGQKNRTEKNPALDSRSSAGSRGGLLGAAIGRDSREVSAFEADRFRLPARDPTIFLVRLSETGVARAPRGFRAGGSGPPLKSQPLHDLLQVGPHLAPVFRRVGPQEVR